MAWRRTAGNRTKRPASGCAPEPVSCRRTVGISGTPRGRGTRGGKKDNGGTQREFEESCRDPREGAYVCARMTPLRLARSDCPIVTRDRRDRFHLWSRMVMTLRRRRKREWHGSHRSSSSGRKWVNRAVRQDEESRAGIRI